MRKWATTNHPVGNEEEEEGSGSPSKAIGNRILFYRQVDQDSIKDLGEQLHEKALEIQSRSLALGLSKPPPIELHINSYGGDIFAGFAGVSHILNCKVPVHTYVSGAAASAATLMSVCGEKRFIYKHSFMLIHQISSGVWGNFEDFKDEMTNMKLLMTTLKSIYQDHTDMPKTQLNNILKRDLWLDAEKCLSWGLVDEII